MINNNFVTFRFILKAITLGLFLTTSSTFAQKRNPIKNSTALPSANILKIKSVAEQTYSHYEAVYEQLHKNPELSGMEKETSDAIAAELGILKKTYSSTNAKLSGNNSKLQIEINRGVGGGYGIVTIIKNGSGPIILLRADMDALPIKEETGLQFESTKRVDAKGNRLPDGSDAGTPVMHACGARRTHDGNAWSA
jgi:metal-dependent amidase/aminoacylase/carboxypeptidase family protein